MYEHKVVPGRTAVHRAVVVTVRIDFAVVGPIGLAEDTMAVEAVEVAGHIDLEVPVPGMGTVDVETEDKARKASGQEVVEQVCCIPTVAGDRETCFRTGLGWEVASTASEAAVVESQDEEAQEGQAAVQDRVDMGWRCSLRQPSCWTVACVAVKVSRPDRW